MRDWTTDTPHAFVGDAVLDFEAKKLAFRKFTSVFTHPGAGDRLTACRNVFSKNAIVNVVHPFNECHGPDGYHARFLMPLENAFEGLYRRDYIMMAGEYDGSEWVSATGYYVGHFNKDWIGIRASNRLAWLRFGEFHRFENGKIVESFVYLDIPELMIACGQWPDEIKSPAEAEGYTGFLPGPATQDGLLLTPQDAAESAKSLTMVEDMLLGLATPDDQWRPYWHDNMMWYGPAAFGSFIGVDNFHAFQVPFEGKFSHWHGGSKPESQTRHFTRYGEGNYVCSGGWPSLNAHQVKEFLGQEATNKTLFMRVCDWWRREGDLLVENWVFVDIPHVLLQMDYDLFAKLGYDGEA